MRKPTESRASTGTTAMAGLLLCGLVCAPLSGCLIPQDDQLLPEIPERLNRAIKVRAAAPLEPRFTFYNSTACPSLNKTFSLVVEDPDVADVTYSKWFVGDRTEASVPFEPTSIAGGQLRRTVNPPSSLGFRSALANLPIGSQLLTVYVSDTPFKEVVGGQVALQDRETLPDGGILDEGTMDEHTWVLDVEPCP